MQRGRVLNLSKFQILDFLKANVYSIVSFLFLILGVVLGLIIFNDFKIIPNLLEKFFGWYIELRQSSDFLKIVFDSFLKSTLLFLIIFVSGTSLFGVVTVPLINSFFGLFYGAAVSYLYSTFAIKGVAFNAVIFLPSNLVLLVFLVLAARLSVKFSLEIAKLTLPNTAQGDLFLLFKEYSIKYLLVCLGGVISALIDGITAISMLRFFEF